MVGSLVPKLKFWILNNDVHKPCHSHETLYNGRHGCDFVDTQTFSINLFPPQLLPLFLYSGDTIGLLRFYCSHIHRKYTFNKSLYLIFSFDILSLINWLCVKCSHSHFTQPFVLLHLQTELSTYFIYLPVL